MMHITIKSSSTNATMTALVDREDSVYFLMCLIEEGLGVPLDQQQLVWWDREIAGHCKVGECGLQHGALVHLNTMMNVEVKNIDTNDIVKIRVDDRATVLDLKGKISQDCGILVTIQLLIFGRKILQDSRMLRDCDVAHKDSLTVTAALARDERRPADQIQIFLKTLDRMQIMTIVLRLSMTVTQVKQVILDQLRLTVQKLIFGRTVLDDQHSLHFYGVKQQSTVHMIVVR
jgi:hypothetical protein